MKTKWSLNLAGICLSMFIAASVQGAPSPEAVYITSEDGTATTGITTDGRLQVDATGTVSVIKPVPDRWDRSVTVTTEDNNVGSAGFPVLTVPAGQRLVITDVVMTHNVITTTNTLPQTNRTIETCLSARVI